MMKSLFSNYLACLLLLGLSNTLFGATAPGTKAASTFYNSGLQEGRIGVTEESPIDNPVDNIFHIALEEAPSHTGRVWLVYELEGVEDHTGVSRSINDQLAIGGYLVKKRAGWARQREQIDARWLKAGDNVIRFTIPEGAKHSYRIRNLSVEVENGSTLTFPLQANIVVNQPVALTYAEDKVYIKGFVPGLRDEAVQIRIDGQPARVSGGAFEAIVTKRLSEEETSLNLNVEAVYPDGTTVCREVEFSQAAHADFAYALEKEGSHIQQLITTQFDCALSLQGAALEVTAGSIQKAAHLSISSLREVDIPALDPGMINVTNYNKGFRFLPHGQVFEQEVKLRLGYDESKIPAGYTAKDIKTYFFDEETHHWIPLPADSLMEEEGALVSRTTHFTDMINAIIQVPESPEVNAYNSTSMKGIKAANPTAAVNLLNPPQANNTGNASMGYPIKLPAGRNGMQPQLAISYNSGGGNSWLGLGWNLNIPAITIDTRWGVPRYDDEFESETYSLNGEQLLPVTHRQFPAESRVADKRFYPRVEGAFNRIIRQGSSTTDYYWIVTDKGGTKYYYGGEASLMDEAVLKDAAGNIAHWALVKVEDLNGNSVRYHYDKVLNPVVPGGIHGQELYISKITYTEHAAAPGKYAVLFEREQGRQDVSINGRSGFKQVTADLLSKIVVQYNNAPVRSYGLKYLTGAFGKSLLESITEFDAEGTEFNAHTFEYFDEVNGETGFKPFRGTEKWVLHDDEIRGGFLSKGDFHDNASVLSGTKSENAGGGAAVTAGPFDGNLATKSNTAGINYTYSRSWSNGRLTTADINGDGLTDKVVMVKEGSRTVLKYRPQLLSAEDGTERFGPLRPISGVDEFLKEKSSSNDFGIESHFGIFAGLNYSMTKSTTSVYFADVNGDGLVDIVKNGRVKFNRLNDAGDPVFIDGSEDTPNPLRPSGTLDAELVRIDEEELAMLKEQYPLHDVVRMWIAPYDGKISITDSVALIEDTSEERAAYTTADGVRVSIEYKNEMIWKTTIGPQDYTVKPAQKSLRVKKGERIFFRVHSIKDGAYDQLRSNPKIHYTKYGSTVADANGLSLYAFQAGKDYVLAAPQTIGMPISGRIKIEGSLFKPVSSDELQLDIIKGEGDTLLTQIFAPEEEVRKEITYEGKVEKGDELRFRLSSPTNLDWSSIRWQPVMYYTESYDSDFTEVRKDSVNLIEIYPVADYGFFAETLIPSTAWEATEDDTLQVKPSLRFSGVANGEIVFSVKRRHELLGRQLLTVKDSAVVGSVETFNIPVKKGDQIYLEYHTLQRPLAYRVQEGKANVWSAKLDTISLLAALHTVIDKKQHIFGSLYRHWGQFAYNGNGTRGNSPIDENLLHLNQFDKEPEKIDLSKAESEEEMNEQFKSSEGYRADKNPFILMLASGSTRSWLGNDDLTYVRRDTISSSRLGMDQLDIAAPSSPGSGISWAVDKITKSNTTSLAANVAAVGANGSFGKSRVLLDFMDMNGDRYPDILGERGIQYTNQFGGFEESFTSHGWSENHFTSLLSGGASVGGGFPKSGKEAGNSPKSSAFSVIGEAASLNASALWSSDKAKYSWMDINGDGLPDRLNQEEGKVAFNLGYTFAPEEVWGSFAIREGSSTNLSGGFGINIQNYSIAAGVGYGRSDNKLLAGLQDMNGDGLPDKVEAKENKILVYLNLGNRFATRYIEWGDIPALSENSSTSLSANIAYTIGFPILPIAPVAKLCVNPKILYSQSFNRQEVQVSDFDGDGFPDYLVSKTKDGKLDVRLSTIGRTNLLKSVQRPMGANFVMEYERVGNTYAMPNAAWVLSEVKVFDGFKGDGVDTLRSSFVYEDGYYDREERDFYGFGKVSTQTLDDNKVEYTRLVQTFHNDTYYKKGLLHKESLLDGNGKKWVEKENVYELKDLGNERIFPALKETYQRFYEGLADAGIKTTTKFEYDSYGNVSKITDEGGEGTEDDLLAAVDYHYLTDKYVVSRPEKIVVSGADKTYRTREADINAKGQVTEIRQYLNEEEAAVHNLKYDAYGNLEKVTRPENAQGERMEITYVYDEVVHSYVEKVTNSYDYSSEATYDFAFGQLLSSTDLNGHKISYTLDKLGRVETITGPYEQKSGAPYTIKFKYFPHAEVPWALTQHYDPANPDNEMETATFVDGLGRVLQTKKDAAIYQGEGAADKEMMIVSGKVFYDAFGRAEEAYYPITEEKKNEGETGTFNKLKEEEINPTLTKYDVLGRTTKVTLPDDSFSEMHYGFAPDNRGQKRFSTRSIDPNKIATEQFTDARGRVTAIRNAGDVWTSFVFNAMGEQLEATNDLGHTTVSAYDQMGRRTSRLHPDAGLTEYKYDLAGNLTELLTANLRESGAGAIRYTYEYDRLTDIEYPQNVENNVHYTYGEAGAAHNRAGRIVIQEDASGAQEFFYGPLGEVVKNVRTIVIPQHDEQTFTTEWTYDTWNRLTEMVYPDGEKVEYTYNIGGLLHSMKGKKKGSEYRYVDKLGYDKFEQRVFLAYGNGTKTTYDYEPERRRLHSMVAKTANGRAMMDNVYKYDEVNNILNLTNNAPVPTSSLMGGSSEYNYEYDELYRLTKAEGSFKGSNHEHRYSLAMSYNTVGGIESKTQLHERKGGDENEWNEQKKTSYSMAYEYGQEQPNAPVHIGEQAYTYDKNGNQTGWTHDVSGQRRQILWDEENRIRTIYDNGAAFHYTYDASGTRVLKGRSSGQAAYVNNEHKGGSGNMGNYTVYVNPYIVLRSGGYTKHYYIEGQRIVSKLGSGLDNKGKGQLKAGNDKVNYPDKQEQSREGIVRNLKFLGHDGAILTAGKSGKIPPGQIIGDGEGGSNGGGKDSEKFQYFYHPDHLGSSSYITDASGEVYQHLEYFAFGETFVEEHSNTHRTPYLYNGKELDEETGLYYYGARYYDPKISMFYGVDPIAEKYVHLSPYNYASNSPVTNIDLWGLQGLHYMEVLNNGTQRHVIEKNVIVLTQAQKAIPAGASERKIARINRKNARIASNNAARVESVRQELNDHFNGSDGQATNSRGEAVRFQFNVVGLEVENTNSVSRSEQTRIATEQGLEGGRPVFDGGPNELAPAAIVTTQPTNQSSTNGVSIQVDDTPGATAHEVGHTLMSRGRNDQESRPGSGGLMVDPPSVVSSREVDKFLQDAIER